MYILLCMYMYIYMCVYISIYLCIYIYTVVIYTRNPKVLYICNYIYRVLYICTYYDMLSWIEKKCRAAKMGRSYLRQVWLVCCCWPALGAVVPPVAHHHRRRGGRWEAGKEWARNGRNKKDQKSICIQYFNICYILYIYIHIIVYTYIYIHLLV